MNKFHIYGSKYFQGKINISGSKNASLPILFSTILTKEQIEIENIPKIKDINNAILILSNLGIQIKKKKSTFFINAKKINKYFIPKIFSKSIRASIWILASMLSRFGKVKLFTPGGCRIGRRPIDLHIKGLKQLGAIIKYKYGYITALSKGRLCGAHINMKKISVGATITIMIAATLANGITIINNAAREPEITDTANFLIILGAKIKGAGSYQIIVQGVKDLHGGKYKILPDRIETGTFLIAAAISKGKITCYNTQPYTLDSVLLKLQETGAKITTGKDWINLDMNKKRPNAVNINTAPYPGIPTDMQSIFTILNVIANGISVITENIFENRFTHIIELIKMGAKIKKIKNKIICYGVKNIYGTKVYPQDLRSSASLVLAGCIAKGFTIVNNIYHIDRGYDSIEYKLNNIGAKIKRIK